MVNCICFFFSNYFDHSDLRRLCQKLGSIFQTELAIKVGHHLSVLHSAVWVEALLLLQN